MEDLSNDIRPKKPISSKMRGLLDVEKANARKRIVERGIVHFRADQEFMEALFDVADRLKIAPGTLCRQIVWEYLKTSKSPSKNAVKTNKLSKRTNDVLVAQLNSLEYMIKEIQSQITGKTLINKVK